jgi:hypothetical protein
VRYCRTKSVLDSLASRPAPKPASSTSSFKPSSSAAAASSTGSTAFELTDSDDDDQPRPARRPTQQGRASQPPPQQQQQRFAPAAASSAARSAARSAASKPAAGRGGSDSDDDFNNLLKDMDSAIDKNPSALRATKLNLRAAPVVHETASAARSSTFGAGAKAKCFPTLLTNGAPNGAKSCAALLCTACDQRVISIKHARWKDAVVEYMFFRNHYPDTDRMSTGVDRHPTSAAFACACSWQSVGVESIGADTLDLNNLREERSKQEGCSSWAKLKWVCTGH